MSVPIIFTQRLQLRQRGPDDFDNCLRMDRDPDVTEFVAGPWTNPAEHSAFLTERMQTAYPAGLGYWSVRRKDGDQGFLGWIMLLAVCHAGDSAEIGWRFNRQSWGQGYGTEAAFAVLEYGLKTLKMQHIFAEIDPRNIGSIRVAEKIGMVANGISSNTDPDDLVFERRAGS